MTLFQSIIGVVFSLGFLALLSFFIGYLIFPVLIILFAIGLFNFFRGNKLFMHTTARFKERPTVRTVYRKKDDNVIDVDYTELP